MTTSTPQRPDSRRKVDLGDDLERVRGLQALLRDQPDLTQSALELATPPGNLSETKLLAQLIHLGLQRVEEASAVAVYDQMAEMDPQQQATSRELTMRARHRRSEAA